MTEPNIELFIESLLKRVEQLRTQANDGWTKLLEEEKERQISSPSESFEHVISRMVGNVRRLTYYDTEKLAFSIISEYHQWLMQNYDLTSRN